VSITMVGVTPEVDHRPAASWARHPLAPPLPSVGSEALSTQGRIVRIRAVAAGDADALFALNRRTSDDSMYLRFFALNRRVADDYVTRLVRAPTADHHALVAVFGDQVVAVAGYERLNASQAEVALLVEDAHQGEGLGTLLLEYLAAQAIACGITEFIGEVLAQNRQMARVFTDSGLPSSYTLEGGTLHVRLGTTPNEATLDAFDAHEEHAQRASLQPLLEPRTVAVIGAGRHGGVGHEVLTAIMGGEFGGTVYPVNPRARSVAGLHAYPTVSTIAGGVDLAVIAVGVQSLLNVVTDCAKAGVRAAVILTAGLAEVGGEGMDLQDRLVRIAHDAGMRLVGPNCLGVVNTDPLVSLEAWFAPVRPVPGHLAFAAQSGAVAIAVVDAASRNGLGVANVVSLGNKSDVSGNDLLLRWWHDDRVRVIALYLESLGNPRKFARFARRVAATKPVLVVKAGRSEAGRRAGRSHTAAAASMDVTVDALFAQAGVLRMDTVEELLDAARVLDTQPVPAGGRIAVVGNAGGIGVLACDAAHAAGLHVPALSEAVRRRLPGPAGVDNPVDLGAGATPDELRRSLTVLADSGEVDALVAVVAATRANKPYELLAAATGSQLPTAAVVVGLSDGPTLLTGSHGRPVPVFAFPESAVRALGHAVRYGRWRRSSRGTVPDLPGIRPEAAGRLIEEFLARDPDGGWLPAEAGRDLLLAYGVVVAPLRVATSVTGAVRAATSLGYPVALKTADPTVVHKSDVGGVVVNVGSHAALRSAYVHIKTAHPGHPVLVQPMVPGPVELLVGAVQEPTFGPLLLLAMGGVWSELLDDRAFRILPVTGADAAAMVGDLRCAPLLYGYRGAPPCDVAALEELLVRVGRLVEDVPEIAELDMNPVRVSENGAVAVDVKVRVEQTTPAPSPLLPAL
jgi:acyl-CoA synthetase (NDP forming)